MAKRSRTKIASPKPRNAEAASLFRRASNAGVAVGVDTRPKVKNSARGYDRRAARQSIRLEAW